MVGVPAVWTGQSPTEQDYADAGKKKRGRPGPAPSGGDRPPMRGGSERPMPQRGTSNRQPGADRSNGRNERRGEDGVPARREVLNTGQRHGARQAAVAAPGLEPQPAIATLSAAQPVAAPPVPQPAAKPQPDRSMNRVRQRPGEGGGDRRPRNGPRDGARDGGGRGEQRSQPQPPRAEAGPKSGFADNVPAFLQKPVRPAKVASD